MSKPGVRETEEEVRGQQSWKESGGAAIAERPQAGCVLWPFLHLESPPDPLEKEMATHPSILTWRIPMDRGAWRATVRGVAESWTRLSSSSRPVVIFLGTLYLLFPSYYTFFPLCTPSMAREWLCQCCRKGGPFQGSRVDSCLTRRNELSEETLMLTQQETLLGRGAQVENSRVRKLRTSLSSGSSFMAVGLVSRLSLANHLAWPIVWLGSSWKVYCGLITASDISPGLFCHFLVQRECPLCYTWGGWGWGRWRDGSRVI